MTYWEIIADSLKKAGWSLGEGLSHFCFFLKREDSEVAAVGFIEWLGLGGKSDTDQG